MKKGNDRVRRVTRYLRAEAALPRILQCQTRATKVLAVGYFLQNPLYGLEHPRRMRHYLEVPAVSRSWNRGRHAGLGRTAEVMWRMDLVARSSPVLGANTDLVARSSWLESNFQSLLLRVNEGPAESPEF